MIFLKHIQYIKPLNLFQFWHFFIFWVLRVKHQSVSVANRFRVQFAISSRFTERSEQHVITLFLIAPINRFGTLQQPMCSIRLHNHSTSYNITVCCIFAENKHYSSVPNTYIMLYRPMILPNLLFNSFNSTSIFLTRRTFEKHECTTSLRDVGRRRRQVGQEKKSNIQLKNISIQCTMNNYLLV